MADFNEAMQQWLAQMQQQGTTGEGYLGNLPVRSNRETSTGPGYMGNLPVRSNRTMTTPTGYNPDLQSPPQTATPPSGGSMPSDMRQMNQTMPQMQPQQQPFAPSQAQPSPVQDHGAGQPAGDGYQLPGFLVQALMKMIGQQPGGPSEMDRRNVSRHQMASEYGGVVRDRPQNGMSARYEYPGAMVRQ